MMPCIFQQAMAILVSWCLLIAGVSDGFGQGLPNNNSNGPAEAVQQSPEQLQQLVAPIALYPDALIAQILSAATYPDQIVEADRWLQQNTNLKGEELGKEVDK